MADLLEVGQVVGSRYAVEALIGVGGLAEVYRVRHTDLGSVHALKLLTWRRKQLAERFEREGRFQAQLGHPNVVTVTDFLRFDGQVALVMEFVDGPTLEQLLAEQGALPPTDAFALFVPMLAAVAAAHDRGVWHRDLKPANVLLAKTPVGFVPKVTDFGIAKFMSEEMGSATSTGLAMGSPGYMAPEQVRDSSTVDARADLFALSAILFEMLTGQRAFTDSDGGVSFASTLDRQPPRLEIEGIEPEVTAAIRKGMAPDREDRYPDCRTFAQALGVSAHPMLLDLALGRGPVVASPVSVSPSVLQAGARRDRSRSGGTPRPSRDPAPSTVDPSPAVPPPPPAPSPSTRTWLVLPFAAGTAGLVSLLGLLVLAVAVFFLGVQGRWGRGDVVPPIDEPPGAATAVVPAPAAGDPGTVVVAEATPGEPDPAAVGALPTEAPPAGASPAPGSTQAAATPSPRVEPDGGGAPQDGVAEVEPPPVEVAPVAPDPVAPVPSVQPAPPTPAPSAAPAIDAASVFRGTWAGKAGGRACALRFDAVEGGAVTATLIFTAGANQTKLPLRGTWSGSELRLSGAQRLSLVGRLDGRTLRGTYAQGDAKGVEFSASAP